MYMYLANNLGSLCGLVGGLLLELLALLLEPIELGLQGVLSVGELHIALHLFQHFLGDLGESRTQELIRMLDRWN